MIKVTLGEVEPQEKPFPKLMKSVFNGNLALVFEREGENKGKYIGLNLTGTQAGLVGFDFKVQNSADYNEPITIQNQ